MTRLALPTARGKTRSRMTYEQFLQWDGDNQHVEWVNGEVVPMTPISDEHNLLSTYLIRLLGEFVEHFGLGQIRTDPFQMKTGPDLPGRAPDILFVTRRRANLIRKTYLDGPADLVIEIISPDSRTIDRVTKFREYEQGGVREYWLLDPERRRAEFYRRGRDGRFRLIQLGDDGIYRSAVVRGLWLHIDWLWARTTLTEVRREWSLS